MEKEEGPSEIIEMTLLRSVDWYMQYILLGKENLWNGPRLI
jgi:hypothetical protein